MSRSWNTWVSQWKLMLGANRRTRRRTPIRVRLRTEIQETRLTPAVTYGMLLGVNANTGGGGGIVPPPDTSAPHVSLDSLGGQTVTTNQTITGTITDSNDSFQTLKVQVFVDNATTPTTTLQVSTSGQFAYTT